MLLRGISRATSHIRANLRPSVSYSHTTSSLNFLSTPSHSTSYYSTATSSNTSSSTSTSTSTSSSSSSSSTTPAIISVAITGDVAQKARVPGLPINPQEQIESIQQCFEAGARHVHIHVRDEHGKPSWNAETYGKVLEGVQKYCPEMIVEFSTGNYAPTLQERIACLDHKPQMASLTPGSVNFRFSRESANQYINTHDDITAICNAMNKNSVKPAVCIFDASMIYSCVDLVERHLVKGPPHIYFVLGGHMALKAREPLLDFLIKESGEMLPGRTWTGIGVGWNHADVIKWTLKKGGHPRTGYEDNLMVKRGVIANNNAELVKSIVQLCSQYGRHPASTEETRKLLNL